MRIVQIIDSLDVGGAEKMAINYANALADRIEFSGLVATRKEGNLKSQINSNVSYLFLKREKTIDISAILKLKNYCKENQVTHLQPHSSSYFTAILVKIICLNLKIIWHDHNGLSEFLSSRKSYALKICSYFFTGIITVNYQLKKWAIKELNCKNVIYLANFTSIDSSFKTETILEGTSGKRILCLANLRSQKNQFYLIQVAKKLKTIYPDWTFHLVGKDFKDDYSAKLKAMVVQEQLEEHVFIYGSKNDTANIINQSDICVFSSSSEGLPVALLEFGLLSKPVVSTEVGEIPLIIQNGENGLLVPVDNVEKFTLAVIDLIENDGMRFNFGKNLKTTIDSNNSENAIIIQYFNWLKTL
ncbi:glycosyltransferase [Flavobacterium sp.]